MMDLKIGGFSWTDRVRKENTAAIRFCDPEGTFTAGPGRQEDDGSIAGREVVPRRGSTQHLVHVVNVAPGTPLPGYGTPLQRRPGSPIRRVISHRGTIALA